MLCPLRLVSAHPAVSPVHLDIVHRALASAPLAPAIETPAAKRMRRTSWRGRAQTLVSNGSSISQPFDQDAWERHRSTRRYFANVLPPPPPPRRRTPPRTPPSAPTYMQSLFADTESEAACKPSGTDFEASPVGSNAMTPDATATFACALCRNLKALLCSWDLVVLSCMAGHRS